MSSGSAELVEGLRENWKTFLWYPNETYSSTSSATIIPEQLCDSCHRWRDPVASRKGRNNKKRGGAIQRSRIEGLGGRNLAGNNPNLDGIGAMFAYESKSGGSFSERYWRWLSGIPKHAGQVGVLIVTETPGRGHKARSIVVVDYDDWRALHGEQQGEEEEQQGEEEEPQDEEEDPAYSVAADLDYDAAREDRYFR